MQYKVKAEISVPEEAPEKYADLSSSEVDRGYRVIGGDKGDLRHEGYVVEDGKTILYKPILVTTYDDLTEDEVDEIAQEILDFSYDSIGVESVM